MNQALLEDRLEASLNSWQQWSIPIAQKPILVRELTGGKTNRSYLIKATLAKAVAEASVESSAITSAVKQNPKPKKPEILAVLRLNTPFAAELGIDREREKIILHKAYKAGIAPEIYFNDLNILVSQYLPGGNLQGKSLNPTQQQNYLLLLKRVHDLSIDLPSFSYLKHTENYWHQLIKADINIPENLIKRRNTLYNLIKNYESTHSRRVLCHHDSGLHNLFEVNETFKLIDWEYAAMGIPDIDFASTGIIKPVNQQATLISDYINDLWVLVKSLIP